MLAAWFQRTRGVHEAECKGVFKAQVYQAREGWMWGLRIKKGAWENLSGFGSVPTLEAARSEVTQRVERIPDNY